EGSIISCNSRFARLLQRAPRALYGKRLLELVAPESRGACESALVECGRGEARTTVMLAREDGTLASVYLGFRPLQEGVLGPTVLVTDMTEQRHYEELLRAQRALRESEERLASDLAAAERLQEISTRLIQQGDVTGLHCEILDAAMDVTGSDFATMQTYDPATGSLRLLADRGFDEAFLHHFARVDERSGSTCGVALRTRKRAIFPDIERVHGAHRPEDLEALRRAGVRALQSTPLVSRSGELLGMISTHWRTVHEPSARDLRLLDVVARQAADLLERSRGEQALREADRNKDEFLATLAHELRNPLAPIRSAVEILKTKSTGVPELAWASSIIDRQVQIMARLLEDLLDVSEVARGTPRLQKRRVRLDEVIQAAVETSRPLAEAAGHDLAVDLPREAILVDADPVRLAQVFANLLNNAAKYTEDGGRIRLAAERRADAVVVTVRDNGIGIPSDLLPRVFELFSHAAILRSQGGLGIGLSLAKRLVELHGGTLEARSDGPGTGSEFVVRLPLPDGDATAGPARPEPLGRRSVAPRRVLVVDDNQDTADSLRELLRALGHDVHAVYDGEQALEAACALRPEVLLLDIGMPRVSGLEVCRRVRNEPWGRDVLVVALTGWGQEEDRARSERAGFDRHLVKPVGVAALLDLLGSLSERDGSAARESGPTL
ncbi:MAG TPA: ATP-binding protein, partial [Longimicrobiales bacterium]|nr:ATP-binding protein [Longimicrobiales bacterium]